MRIFTLVFTLALAGTAFAQERLNLAAPETKPSNTQYRVHSVVADRDNPATADVDESSVSVVLQGQNGEVLACTYRPTTQAIASGQLYRLLNRGDFSRAYVAANVNPANTLAAITGTRDQYLMHRLAIWGDSTEVCGKTLTGTLAGTVQ